MKGAGSVLAGLLVAALAVGAPPARKAPPRPTPPPIDFSGVWQIDTSASANVPRQMERAILSVTQTGNRIWISPVRVDTHGSLVMAEEIVVDGRPYEKALGPAGKGFVTAQWGKDGRSLWIDVKAGPPDDPKKDASQRSVWRLSQDRNTWIRESVSFSQATPRVARLVFRRTTLPKTPTPSRAVRTPAPRGAR